MEQITKVLRELRNENRRTQEYVANKIGISQSQYNKIERGDKPLEFNTLVAICKIFNVEPKKVFAEIFDNGNAKAPTIIDASYGKTKQNPEESTYYQRMATHFEEKFLSVYRQYIELCSKHGVEPPANSVQPISIAS
jgi:transcriptional regulator with XRE-family HTH domain